MSVSNCTCASVYACTQVYVCVCVWCVCARVRECVLGVSKCAISGPISVRAFLSEYK